MYATDFQYIRPEGTVRYGKMIFSAGYDPSERNVYVMFQTWKITIFSFYISVKMLYTGLHHSDTWFLM